MTECQRCGTRMSYNDQTTKVTEFACPRCHNTRIEWKAGHRVTG
jgi:DNA-directed RNA polymerase subunit RPC12/RpoP